MFVIPRILFRCDSWSDQPTTYFPVLSKKNKEECYVPLIDPDSNCWRFCFCLSFDPDVLVGMISGQIRILEKQTRWEEKKKKRTSKEEGRCAMSWTLLQMNKMNEKEEEKRERERKRAGVRQRAIRVGSIERKVDKAMERRKWGGWPSARVMIRWDRCERECVRVVYRVESVSMYVSVGHGPRGKRREGKDV